MINEQDYPVPNYTIVLTVGLWMEVWGFTWLVY